MFRSGEAERVADDALLLQVVHAGVALARAGALRATGVRPGDALAQQGGEGRGLAARFARVEFLPGGQVQVQASGGVVHITVAPGRGVAGRPSSQRIYLQLRQR